MICQTDNAAGEVYPILPRCRRSHVKQQIQYELTCFSPFLATRCLHVTNDFRVYSQLSLPIRRLSAYTLCVAKTKALISFAATAKLKLICVFVFAYAKCWFSHDAAHIMLLFIGSYFVTEDDLRDYGNLKIDNVARSIKTILRHCKRVREVRAGKITRIVYIDSY